MVSLIIEFDLGTLTAFFLSKFHKFCRIVCSGEGKIRQEEVPCSLQAQQCEKECWNMNQHLSLFTSLEQ